MTAPKHKYESKPKPKKFYIVNTKEVGYSFVVEGVGVVKIDPGYNAFDSKESRDKVLQELAKTFPEANVALEEKHGS